MIGAQWPLVGRAGELRRMQGLLRSGKSALVLAGPAGVGKSRLALELVGQADPAGMAVVRVTATRAASDLPLGAFTSQLSGLHHGEPIGVDDRAELLRRCADVLLQSTGGRRLVILVDDAHLLDDVSATLVHQLATGGLAFVVATLRSGEAAPDPIVALWKDDAVERLDVSGLRSDAVHELLLAVLGGPIDPGAVNRLAIGCQGNVLFLRELVRGALEDGTLRRNVGIWELVGPLSPSSRLAELVESRLQGLDPVERTFLEAVSFGEPLGTAELQAIGDPAVAQRLERQGLIASSMDGRRLVLRLAHPLYGDVLRGCTPVLRSQEIARLLAEVVESTGARRRSDILRVATWRLEGGDARPELMLEAAFMARWRYDFPLAERLAHVAIQGGAGFDAKLLAAKLASLQGLGPQAEKQFAALTLEASTDRERGLVATARLDNHIFHMGQIDLGLKMAEEASATITDTGWQDEIAARRSGAMAGRFGPRATVELAEPLLERAGGRALAMAAMNAGYALARMGRLGAAQRAAAKGREAHLALSEPFEWYPWTHTFTEVEALAYAGRLNEAFDLAQGQYQQGLTDRSPEAQAWFAWELSRNVADRGYPHAAAVHGRTAAALFGQLGRPMFEDLALGYLALALAIAGQPREARQALTDKEKLGLPRAKYLLVDLMQAEAWTAAAEGDLPKARVLLNDAIAVGVEIGDLVGQSTALHALARTGHPAEAAEGLAELAPQIEGDLAATRAAHAAALVRGDADALQEASRTFEAMGAVLLAAEAEADAAVAWRRASDPRRGTRAEQRANSLAGRCEQPVTPALQAVMGRSRLTTMERETALLAVAGRSNKEIAGQLSLSVRTVENHLQHVYEKLGISGRIELAEGLENAY